MTTSDFWNSAFLAALHRLPVEQAKIEADKATETVIQHWHNHIDDYMPTVTHRTNLDISRHPRQL